MAQCKIKWKQQWQNTDTIICNYTTRSYSRETCIYSAGQEISCYLWKRNVHYHVNKSLPLEPIPSHTPSLNSNSLKIHFNMSRFPTWSLPLTISVKLFMHYISPTCVLHVPSIQFVFYSTRGGFSRQWLWRLLYFWDVMPCDPGRNVPAFQRNLALLSSGWVTLLTDNMHLLQEESNPPFLIWSLYNYFVNLLIM